jgi:dUTP pyrophosphatase
MNYTNIHVKLLHPLWSEHDLRGATDGSCGLDLKACLTEETVCLAPGGRVAVPSGLAIDIRQPGIAGFIFSRSGLGTKQGVVVSQGVGVIDPDYRGEIIVSLLNTSSKVAEITRGQRIAQLIFLPFFLAKFTVQGELSATSRGAGGFGHTGEM